MKTFKILIGFHLVLLCFPEATVNGQTYDCYQTYEKALLFYNKGYADSVLNVLKPCIESRGSHYKLSVEHEGRIFRLAALASIMKGKPADAENYVKQMLECLPYYKNSINEEDLMEFRLILDKLSVQPFWRIGILAGANYPFTHLSKTYSYYAGPGAEYRLWNSPGYQVGITAERFLTRNISLEAGALMSQYTFRYGVKTSSEQYVYYNQDIYMAEIPVMAKYYFLKGAFRPYIEGGISGRFLLNSIEKSDVYGKYWFTNSSNSDKVLATFISDFEYLNFGFGGGAAYDLKGYSVRMDIRYNQSMKSNLLSRFNNINDYSDISAEEKFSYTDDINVISFNNISISVSLVYNLKYKVF